MDWSIAALLFAAGAVGGVMSAVAGGAGLVTFPALLAAGLPPIVANASNSIAVVPGHLVAAFADRKSLPAPTAALWIAAGAIVLGSVAGCLLLLATPERLFTALVPALIAFATLVFAFGKRVQAEMQGWRRREALRPLLLAPTAVYGGYFGAGLGLMMLTVLTVTGREPLREANALKNLLATAISVVTLVIFTHQQAVHWPATIVMFAGATLGGAVGGRLAAVLPLQAMRAVVIAIGVAMTLTYAWRYWG